MAKKHIGEILYNESKEYNTLILFVKAHQLKHYPCRGICSTKAYKEYDLDLHTGANFIAGYIEYLQNEIETFKTK